MRSRHTVEIAQALAERIGQVEALGPQDPDAGLAAFTVPGMGKSVWGMIEHDLKEAGVKDMTSQYGERLVEKERCSYLRPVVVHCQSPENEIAKKEYMFPFSTVVECPEDQMLKQIGPTLVCTGITNNEQHMDAMTNATFIDRLNLGSIPTSRVSWDQPHEGNMFDHLYRQRAFQAVGA